MHNTLRNYASLRVKLDEMAEGSLGNMSGILKKFNSCTQRVILSPQLKPSLSSHGHNYLIDLYPQFFPAQDKYK